MTARVRLLALDIDGTLLGGDKRISPRTLKAVAAARASGVRVVLVTGRRYPAARPIAVQLGSGVPLVLHHGARRGRSGASHSGHMLARRQP